MHQEIFVCFKFRWTEIRVRTIRKYFFVFTMLEVEPKYTHMVLLKFEVCTVC